MNIASIIELSCMGNADRLCVVDDHHRLTYRQMAKRADRLAHALVEMGVEPGDRVALFLTNCYQFIEMFYAVTKIGAVFVSLNYRLRGRETTHILNDAAAKVLILEDRYEELIQSIRTDLPSIEAYIVIGNASSDMHAYETLLSAQSEEPYPVVELDDDAIFTIIYTSGTTGLPKGAMLAHANLIAAMEAAAAAAEDAEPAPPAIQLVTIPMYHIAGVLAPVGTVRGNTAVILPRFDPVLFLEAVEKEKVTTTYLVPTMLRTILDHPDFSKYDLRSLKSITYGAAQMPIDLLLRALEMLPADYTNTFGQTEGLGTITSLTPEDHKLEGSKEEIDNKIRRLSGVGKVIPGYEIRVVDDEGRDVPVGEIGEFIARGRSTMKGYWNKPDASEEVFDEGWLHTGDLVTMDEDGYLYTAGRKKDMINRAGENIYPVEVEEVLDSHPKVSESAVFGVPDEYWGEIVKAVVVLRSGEAADAEELIAYCRENLASYKKPSIVEFVDELPKSAVGKVLKNLLREM